MNDIVRQLKPVLRKFLRIVDKRTLWLVRSIDSRYTLLVIFIAGTIGTILFFAIGSACRYNRFDWWRWKQKAFYSSMKLWTFLLIAKGVLYILK